jgi:hypothetical protein
MRAVSGSAASTLPLFAVVSVVSTPVRAEYESAAPQEMRYVRWLMLKPD